MQRQLLVSALEILLLLSLLPRCPAQMQQPGRSVRIAGKTGQAAAIEVNGRTYVDIKELAGINHWSVTATGDGITLSSTALHEGSPVGNSPQQPYQESTDTPALSRDFMRAGIEEFATMREWASTLAYAIQTGYQVSEDWVANYSQEASHKLGLASAAASTHGDHRALSLLTNEFQSIKQWSDKLVQERKSLDTAKYAVSPSALREDPLSKQIVTCGRFLATMLGSASFQDDPSCH